MAGQALQSGGNFEQLRHLRVVLFHLAQLRRLFERVLEADVQGVRHQLGDLVDLGEGQVERPARISDHRLRAHGAEGDDLAHILAAVFFRYVVDHVDAATHAEIDVDIRKSDALRIEKTLEEQTVLQRIDVRNLQGVGYQAARRRPASRPHRNAFLARKPDKIPDNQEIARKPHLLDEFDFAIQALLVGLERVLQPAGGAQPFQPLAAPDESFPRDPFKEAVQGLTRGDGEVRKDVLLLLQMHVAARRNFRRARQRLRNLAEELLHLREGFEVELLRRKLHAGGIIDGFPRLDTHQHVLGACIGLRDVMTVVGGHKGNSRLSREPHQLRINALLLGNPVVLNFEEEIAFAEDVSQVVSRPLGGFVTVRGKRRRHFSAKAGGEADQPVGVPGQQVFIDAGLVIKALRVGRGSELHQIAVASLVLAENHQVVRTVGVLSLVKAVGRRHVNFAADDGFQAALHGRFVKLHRAKQVSVVGDGHRGLFQLRGAVHQPRHLTGAVEQTVIRMKMKVNKIRGCHRESILTEKSPGSRSR